MNLKTKKREALDFFFVLPQVTSSLALYYMLYNIFAAKWIAFSVTFSYLADAFLATNSQPKQLFDHGLRISKLNAVSLL